MSNLHELEFIVAERQREVERELERNVLLEQMPRPKPTARLKKPALKVRFGFLLIRLGSRLAA